MCFYIHKDHASPKIATEDIITLKTGRRKNLIPFTFKAVHMNFRYVRWKKQPQVSLRIYHDEIDAGYHSRSNIEAMRRLDKKGGLKVMKIPKGATYYFNPTREEYVSDTIIYMGRASLFNKILAHLNLFPKFY